MSGNREEKKKYLNAYLELKRKVEALTEESNFWYETSVSVPIGRIEATGVKSSGKPKKDTVIEHLDICLKIEKIQQEAQQKLEEILSVISEVDDADQRSVLTYRYINGLYFFEIAKRMKYSVQNVYILHSKALDNVKIRVN